MKRLLVLLLLLGGCFHTPYILRDYIRGYPAYVRTNELLLSIETGTSNEIDYRFDKTITRYFYQGTTNQRLTIRRHRNTKLHSEISDLTFDLSHSDTVRFDNFTIAFLEADFNGARYIILSDPD